MTDLDGRNHYELLGLEPGATTEAIKEAYREIARIYHPDSNFYDDIIADAGPDDSDVFKAITAAYHVLVNEEKRSAYDNTLPKGLTDWGEEDGSGDSSRGVYTAGADESLDEEIPEEWRKEREYFAEHFEEILKPGPRSNLVAGGGEVPKAKIPNEGGIDPFGTWEEESVTVQAGTRFGDLTENGALGLMEVVPVSRRAVETSTAEAPFKWMMYLGIPFMTIVVIAEIFWLRR